MSIKAIIAEYNPFHNGHLYQIKSINSDYTIVIMSASFTQRGTPAILDKFTRSRLAIENGADLVLELPTIYCTSNAQIFSEGAISILNSLNIVDTLCFGSENSLSDIVDVASKTEYIDDKALATNLSKGYSFIKAKQLSYKNLSDTEFEIMNKPNNILGIEYVKALKKFNSEIIPFSIPRKNVGHSSEIIVDGFASASTIRNISNNKNFSELKNLVPENTYVALQEKGNDVSQNFFQLFKYKLLSGNINFSNYMDYELGLENRLHSYLDTLDYNEYIEFVSTKRYTKSRIRRLICQIVFDLKREFILESINHPYVRVLGMNTNGTDLLNKLKEKKIKYITKFSDKTIFSKHIKKIIHKEVLVSNTYNMLQNTPLNQDYKNNPYIQT